MSYLIERLLELEKHLGHLRQLAPKISGAGELHRLEPVAEFAAGVRRIAEKEGWADGG